MSEPSPTPISEAPPPTIVVSSHMLGVRAEHLIVDTHNEGSDGTALVRIWSDMSSVTLTIDSTHGDTDELRRIAAVLLNEADRIDHERREADPVAQVNEALDTGAAA